MRLVPVAGIAAVVAVAACSITDHGRLTPSGPQFAQVQTLGGLPDLIVDGKRLADSWVVYDETFLPTTCSVIEGGVQAGDHRVLRFTVTTPNIGTANLALGDPNIHVANNDGLYEFAVCHNHYHFRHYAKYELLSADKSKTWRAAKRGFCMIDVTPWQFDGGVGSWVYRICGRVGVPGNQGISVGYADTYFKWLGGQYFVLDGGDGQAPIPPGNYIIRITVNPPFVAANGEPCPHVDLAGFCHQLPESNYDNNVAEVLITIPDGVGKTGFGPGAGIAPPDELIDDENRPDKP
ncbi:MAG TPA: lysyl oxidase family protein [Gemmatimonadales bacterium]|nr:lysyl oxidase family protein [Gemmatimonadales bacterium]